MDSNPGHGDGSVPRSRQTVAPDTNTGSLLPVRANAIKIRKVAAFPLPVSGTDDPNRRKGVHRRLFHQHKKEIVVSDKGMSGNT